MFTRMERYWGAPTKGRGRDIQTLKWCSSDRGWSYWTESTTGDSSNQDQDKGTKADGQDEKSQRNGMGTGEGDWSLHSSSSKTPTGARAPSFTLSPVMVDFMAYVWISASVLVYFLYSSKRIFMVSDPLSPPMLLLLWFTVISVKQLLRLPHFLFAVFPFCIPFIGITLVWVYFKILICSPLIFLYSLSL